MIMSGGRPVYGDQLLFEMLVLESAQAGLSWETALKKREHYRQLMYNFDPEKVARISSDQIQAMLSDSEIIRHRRKLGDCNLFCVTAYHYSPTLGLNASILKL